MTRPLILLLAFALAACGSDAPEASGEERDNRDPIEADARLVAVEDAEALVDELLEEGHETTVLNFWATWCGPCRIEFPDLIAYDSAMADTGVEVRFVSVDDREMIPAVTDFLDEQGVTERVYISPNNTTLAGQFNPAFAASLPYTLVLDADGIVRAAHMGVISPDKLTEMVAGVRDGSIDITTQL